MLWYQGEADTRYQPQLYDERLGLLIRDWREWWGLPELAFGIVQLPNFLQNNDFPGGDAWAELRESQRRLALKTPMCGLIITIDCGEPNELHPPQKQIVGRRLARWALSDIYKVLSLRGGPELDRVVCASGQIKLCFKSSYSGVKALNYNDLFGFSVAGEDRIFTPVKARIYGNEIIVSYPQTISPAWLRYAWGDAPSQANLGNMHRLPASPFEVEL